MAGQKDNYENISELGRTCFKEIEDAFAHPDKIIFNYNKEKYTKLKDALYRCIDKGHDISSIVDGMDKETFNIVYRDKTAWRLYSLYNMGKQAKSGNEEAEKDMQRWFSRMNWIFSSDADKVLLKYHGRTNYQN